VQKNIANKSKNIKDIDRVVHVTGRVAY